MKSISALFIFAVLVFPSSMTYAQNVTLYVVPAISDSYILPNSSISSSYLSSNISIKASPGEFEPASFVVRPAANLTSLMLEASDLNSGSVAILAANVNIKVVKVWNQKAHRIIEDDWDTPVGTGMILSPELLLNDDSLVNVVGSTNYLKINGNYVSISGTSGVSGLSSQAYATASEFPVQDAATLLPVNIGANTNKQFWITVKVPNGTPGGNYTGTISLKTGTIPVGTLSLKVQVWPITLADPYLSYNLYYTGRLKPSAYISSEYKSAVQMLAEFQDMHDHGVLDPNLYGQDSNTQLGQVINLRTQAGLKNEPLYYLGLRPIDSCSIDLNAFKSSITSFKNYVSTNFGINNVYFYLLDEADESTTACRAVMQAVHDAGGKTMVADGWDYAKKYPDVLDWVTIAYSLDKTYPPVFHNYGHPICSYGNPFSGHEESTATYRKNFGLMLWQYGYDCAANWAYQDNEDSNSWDDFDARDLSFTYPTVNGVIDTIEWEGSREGVDDVRYLTTLLALINSSKAGGKDTSAAEAWLAALKGTNLSTQDLDSVRSQMAVYILALQNGSVTTSSTTTTTTTTTTSSTTTSTTVSSSSTSVVSSSSTVSSTSTTLRKRADANGDGFVNYYDLLILAGSYDTSGGEAGFDVRADFNADGVIDYSDLIILAVEYDS